MKMNLPNKLTIARLLTIPLFSFFIVYDIFDGRGSFPLTRIVAALIFIAASFTDWLDGYIARKHNMITDFGKFMDPLADKFMIFAAMFAICVSDYIFPDWYVFSADVFRHIFFWCSSIVIFRELAVTSMRLVVASTGVVVAASWIAKIKTTTQMVSVAIIILEPVLFPFCKGILSLVSMAVMVYFTLHSGFDYFKAYWKYLDTNK